MFAWQAQRCHGKWNERTGHKCAFFFWGSIPQCSGRGHGLWNLCVTTGVGDTSETVGDTGWIVPPSDPEKLVLRIAYALG